MIRARDRVRVGVSLSISTGVSVTVRISFGSAHLGDLAEVQGPLAEEVRQDRNAHVAHVDAELAGRPQLQWQAQVSSASFVCAVLEIAGAVKHNLYALARMPGPVVGSYQNRSDEYALSAGHSTRLCRAESVRCHAESKCLTKQAQGCIGTAPTERACLMPSASDGEMRPRCFANSLYAPYCNSGTVLQQTAARVRIRYSPRSHMLTSNKLAKRAATCTPADSVNLHMRANRFQLPGLGLSCAGNQRRAERFKASSASSRTCRCQWPCPRG